MPDIDNQRDLDSAAVFASSEWHLLAFIPLFVKSEHALAIPLLFYVVWVCEVTELDPNFEYYVTLHISIAAGLISVASSFGAFSGKKWVHLIHGFTLLSAFLVWFIGSMSDCS